MNHLQTFAQKPVIITFVICSVVFSIGFYMLFAQSIGPLDTTEVYAGPKTAEVVLRPTGFEPDFLDVDTGTLVTFTNKTAGPLWLSSKEGAELEGFGTSGLVNPNQSYSFLYNQEGTFIYIDRSRDSYQGVIQVTDPR